MHALSKLTSDICCYKNDKKGVGAILIDNEKAFDTVWLDGQIAKLFWYGFPIQIISILNNMLHEKTFFVKDFNNNSSRLFTLKTAYSKVQS